MKPGDAEYDKLVMDLRQRIASNTVPDNKIDYSNIPELDDEFIKNAKLVLPHSDIQLKKRGRPKGSKNKPKDKK